MLAVYLSFALSSGALTLALVGIYEKRLIAAVKRSGLCSVACVLEDLLVWHAKIMWCQVIGALVLLAIGVLQRMLGG